MFKKLLSAIGLLAVAAPATLSVVACGGEKSPQTNSEQKEADALKGDIEGLTDVEISIVDEADAKLQIRDRIDGLKDQNSTLKLDYTFGEYTEPTAEVPVPFAVTVSIQKETGDELASAKQEFSLKLITEDDQIVVQIINQLRFAGSFVGDMLNLNNESIDTIKVSFITLFKNYFEFVKNSNSDIDIDWNDEAINILGFYDENDRELSKDDFQYQDGKIVFSQLKVKYDYGTVKNVVLIFKDLILEQ